MLFMLDGGPRAGELVDDLPSDYAIDEASARRIEILEGFVAQVATWHSASPRLWDVARGPRR